MGNHVLSVAPWLSDRRCAYSITYDDGLIETAGFAWTIHREYGIPGHVNLWPEKMGKLEGDSSAGFLQSLWNLQKYMDADTIQFLMSEGWSSGCQFQANSRPPSMETLAEARATLEKGIGCPVSALAVSDHDEYVACRDVTFEAGFEWLMTVHDALNEPEDHVPIIRRSPLFHCGPAPILLAFDPYRLLASAWERRGWIVDVVRLVDRFPQNPARDCQPAELEKRFAALRRIAGDDVWTACPESVARYRHWRHITRCVENPCAENGRMSWRVEVAAGAPLSIPDLTFLVQPDDGWGRPTVLVDGEEKTLVGAREPGRWRFDHQPRAGQRIEVSFAGGRS